MVDIDTDKKCFDYETYHEGENKVLKIYLESSAIPPSIEYSPECMAKVIDLILKVSGVTNVVLSQRRSYDYDFSQVEILIELARLYHKINKEERYKYSFLVTLKSLI